MIPQTPHHTKLALLGRRYEINFSIIVFVLLFLLPFLIQFRFTLSVDIWPPLVTTKNTQSLKDQSDRERTHTQMPVKLETHGGHQPCADTTRPTKQYKLIQMGKPYHVWLPFVQRPFLLPAAIPSVWDRDNGAWKMVKTVLAKSFHPSSLRHKVGKLEECVVRLSGRKWNTLKVNNLESLWCVRQARRHGLMGERWYYLSWWGLFLFCTFATLTTFILRLCDETWHLKMWHIFNAFFAMFLNQPRTYPFLTFAITASAAHYAAQHSASSQRTPLIHVWSKQACEHAKLNECASGNGDGNDLHKYAF